MKSGQHINITHALSMKKAAEKKQDKRNHSLLDSLLIPRSSCDVLSKKDSARSSST